MADRDSHPDMHGATMIYAVLLLGVGLALLFRFLFPPEPMPPLPRGDAIGCYVAPGWPVVEVTEERMRLPGAPDQRWETRWFKQANGLAVEPGFESVPEEKGGHFTAGHTGFLNRLDRNSEGRLLPSRATGRIGFLDIGGIIFERAPCAG